MNSLSSSLRPDHLAAFPLEERFTIVRRLGGTLSHTYLAQDMTTADLLPCVIKQLHYTGKTDLAQERTSRRLRRYARSMARLSQQGQLPRLLNHFTDGDQFYLVQEYIPGMTLAQELSRSGHKSEPQVQQFLQEMLPIVGYIHRRHLLHLDIRPAHIIRRSRDQKLVLTGFGTMHRYAHTDKSEAKRAGDRTLGTVGFSPLEQICGHPKPASDIYALGATCLALLTGRSPVALATAPRGQHLQWQSSVSISPHFLQVLKRMLDANPAHRFQTVDELGRALNLQETDDSDLIGCLTSEPFASVSPSAQALPKKVRKGVATAPPQILEKNLEEKELKEELKEKDVKRELGKNLENYVEINASSSAQRRAEAIHRWQQRRRQFEAFAPATREHSHTQRFSSPD